MRNCLLTIISSLMFCSCSLNSWQSEHHQEHPLVGVIWDQSSKKQISNDELVEALKTQDYVLLGEKHDNPDHHFLQARILRKIADKNTDVVFEQVTADKQEALESSILKDLPDNLSWSTGGWPPWEIYEPVFKAALNSNSSLIAGKFSKKRTKSIAKGDSSEKEFASKYLLHQTLPKKLDEELKEELFVSHCKQIPENALSKIAAVQRTWDASMADSLASAPGKKKILIAGNAHIRQDRGVPYYLKLVRPNKRAISVAFIEVDPDHMEASDYSSFSRPEFDYIWFTPVYDTEDPCEKYFKRR